MAVGFAAPFVARPWLSRSFERHLHCRCSVSPPSLKSEALPETKTAEVRRAVKLSLPTHRERRFLEERGVQRAKGRSHFFARTSAFTVSIWPLVVAEKNEHTVVPEKRKPSVPESPESGFAEGVVADDESSAFVLATSEPHTVTSSLAQEVVAAPFEIPPWAYIVCVRATKLTVGKRAVVRNRACRRVRAAAMSLMPAHAHRGRLYLFTAMPEMLTIHWEDLVEDMETALRTTGCWEDVLPDAALKRERYCKRR